MRGGVRLNGLAPWPALNRCACTGRDYALLVSGGVRLAHAAALAEAGGHWVLGGLKKTGKLTGYHAVPAHKAPEWLETHGPFAQVCAWPASSCEDAAGLSALLTERA